VLQRGTVETVDTLDALHLLLASLQEELQQPPPANAKLLPRAMRWCSTHLTELAALMRCSAPAWAYAPAKRLGRHRLLVLQLISALVDARRASLTSAIAATRPCLLCEAVQLVEAHPTSSPLHSEVLKLLNAATQVKPLRSAMTAPSFAAGALPVQTLVAAALMAPSPAIASRPIWLEIASILQRCAQSDKQLKQTLAADAAWLELSEQLPGFRDAHVVGQLCGPPPARPSAGGELGGEMGELIRLLNQMPNQT